MKKIDALGKACPQPVIMTKKVWDEMDKGKIEVIVDNEIAVQNLLRFAESQGGSAQSKKDGDNFLIEIIKEGESVKEEELASGPVQSIAFGQEYLGKGSDELGRILMNSMIYTISETDPLPESLIFFNGGVFLTLKDSKVLDDLKKMEEAGVRIISCGTCLDFFEKKEELAIGEISNMYTIYEEMRAKNALILD